MRLRVRPGNGPGGGTPGLQRGRALEKRSDLCLHLRSDTDERPGSTLHLPASTPEREGTSLGLLIDAYGNDYYKEQHRIVSEFGEGWLYYSFTNFTTDRDEPKLAYIKGIDWYGTPAAIGAGIYLRDIPGTCESEDVNAMGLEAEPSDETAAGVRSLRRHGA